MVVANTQCIADNLNIGMPVSKMPSEAHEFARRACANFQKRLWFSDDLHDPTGVEHESVAIP